MKYGQTRAGFTKTDGAIRTLTLREKLNQVVKFKQPQDIEIHGKVFSIGVSDAVAYLTRFKNEILDR